MDRQLLMNKITLRGTITATRMTARNRAIYTIASDGDRGNSVFVEVIHMVGSPEETFRIGDNVTAICHARSGKSTSEDNETIYFKQIVADSVFKTERILRSYFVDIPEEGTILGDVNEFIFCGEVMRVSDRPGRRNLVLVSLKIPDTNYYNNYVEIAGFKNQASKMRMAKVGDIMAIAGSIRTMKRADKYMFDYVAKDVYLQRTDKVEE